MDFKVNSAFIILCVFISFGVISSDGIRLEQNSEGSSGRDPLHGQSSVAPAPGDPVRFGSGLECPLGCVPGEIIPAPTVSTMSVSQPIPVPNTMEPKCGPGCLPMCVPQWDTHLEDTVLLCYGSDAMGFRNFEWDRYHGRYAAFRIADGMNKAVNIAEPDPDHNSQP